MTCLLSLRVAFGAAPQATTDNVRQPAERRNSAGAPYSLVAPQFEGV